MRKYLSIIIPRYKETEKDLFPLLTSINNQIGLDFNDIELIIANDGGGAGPLDDGFLSFFNMEIKQVNLSKNGGPGVARQAGLDIATGEYVMFCDADDIIHNVGVIHAMILDCEENVSDMLSTDWIEEIYNSDTSSIQYITHTAEITWMHGKFLRRKFLQKNFF